MKKSSYLVNGFTLIEILVTLVILLIGLLGIAALQAKSQQIQVESYQRAQAVLLLKEMEQRLNANRQRAAAYAITTDVTNGAPFVGVGVTTLPTTVITDVVATQDLQAWNAALKGVAETSGGQNIGAMIGARGCIRAVAGATNRYEITIAWQGFGSTEAPTNTCAKGLYGSESQRRLVSITVDIASITAL